MFQPIKIHMSITAATHIVVICSLLGWDNPPVCCCNKREAGGVLDEVGGGGREVGTVKTIVVVVATTKVCVRTVDGVANSVGRGLLVVAITNISSTKEIMLRLYPVPI